MRILREVERIDRYLQGKMDPASRLLFDAELLIDPLFAKRFSYQQTLYQIIKNSGRRELKRELEVIHRQLLSDPLKMDFRNEILKLFSKA